MRGRLVWVGAAVVAAGCSGAGNDPPGAAASPVAAGSSASPSSAAPAPREFAAEVVAVDPVARTVTLREAAPGGTTTVPVEVQAMGSLRDYKTGDRVVVSCRTAGAALSGCGAVASIRRAR